MDAGITSDGSAPMKAGIEWDLGIRRRTGSIFYGWWIAIAGSFTMAVNSGLNFYGFSAFFVPLSEEFGWSRTAMSTVFSMSRLEGGLLGPIEGYAIDKLGPRRMMLIGIPLCAVGFFLLSQIDSLVQLYLVYLLAIALGSGLGFSSAVAACIANWFRTKRSRAFGLLWSGVAIGGATIVPLVAWTIDNHGWRTAALMSGAIILAIGLPVAAFMRRRPEDYGLLPDGEKTVRTRPGVPRHVGGLNVHTEEQAEMKPLEALKTPVFWLLGLSTSLRCVVTSGMVIHFVAMMTDRGMSITLAGSMLGWVALMSITGRLGVGWLGDKWDKRYLLAVLLGVMSLTMIGLSQVSSLVPVLLILVVYAGVYGGSTVMPLSLQADLFGRNSFATIRGLVHTVQMVGMLLGPILAGFVYDTTHSYFVAFVVFAVAAFLGMLAILATKLPGLGPRDEQRRMAA